MSSRNYILFVLVCLTFLSCGELKFSSEQECYKYINNPKHGYVKTKEYDNIIFKVKYIPPEILLANELKYVDKSMINKNYIDSIYKLYSTSRTFLFTISTQTESSEDIMYKGVQSEEDYKLRFEELNFGVQENIQLNTADNQYFPSLVNLENIYGLSKSRKINVVFSPKDKTKDLYDAKELDFVFQDYIFGTGISHFKFNKSQIDRKLNLDFN